MKCSRCGAQNPGDARLCDNCGEPLAAPAGAELLGPPIEYTPRHIAERILAGREAIRGERKQVTVLFCDVVESTRLADELGPEGMHGLLQRFFRTALESIHRYEGTVNQFLGDGFMAIFGAPIAHQDHAARAALAAIALRDAVETDREPSPIVGWDRLRLRMGLNSGPVVVGGIGDDLRVDYTAVGDTTNLAARLQTSAAPGEILIGGATARSAGDVLQTEELEPRAVKGKEHPIEAFRLLEATPFTVRSASRKTGFVGRDVELAQLRSALDLARTGTGAIVDIEGEPGVGKSRLVLEFTASVDEEARVVRGRCVTYGSQVPNIPIVDLVRDLSGAPPDEEPGLALARIAEVLNADPDEADFLGALIGVSASLDRLRDVDAATLRGRTSQALRRLLFVTGKERPVVAVIEDLHWADASSLEFLSELVSTIIGSSLLVVATFRPGSSPPWAANPDVTSIELSPLDEAESELIVRGLPESSSLSGAEVRLVLDRGEGNPFFLEELSRAVAHGGGQEVPGTVEDVIAARIDRLEENAKDVLRSASVIGRDFETDLLSAVTETDGKLGPILDRLGRLGFIGPASEGRHTFVHALTQDVAYGSMLTAQRQGLHATVGTILRQRYESTPERACEEIARHLLLGPDPAGAVPFLELANEKAMRTHAMEEARGFFEKALDLLEAQEPTIENATHRMNLVVAEWPVYHFMHAHEEYAALIERYAPLADQVDRPEVRGPFLAQRGHRLWVFARYGEAEPMLQEGFTLCRDVGDIANAAHAQAMLQWLNVWTGNYEAADRHGSAVLETMESFSIPILRTFTPVALSLSHGFRGRWDDAIGWCDRAHRFGIEIGDDGMASFASGFQAFAHLLRGDVDAAIAVGQRAVGEAPTVYFRGWGQAFAAAAMCKTDQVHPGVDILQEVCDFIRKSRHDSGYLMTGQLLAEGWLLAQDPERSRAVAAELETWTARARVPFVHAGSEVLLGETSLIEGAPGEATDRFRRAAEEFRSIGAENGRAQALSGLGRAALASGNEEKAAPFLEEALATFERLGTLGEPERVREVLATIR